MSERRGRRSTFAYTPNRPHAGIRRPVETIGLMEYPFPADRRCVHMLHILSLIFVALLVLATVDGLAAISRPVFSKRG
jgi:hypothetical protein